MTKPSVIDLFSGCGGMSLGLEKAGYDVVYANDINGDALKTYKHNFPNVLVEQGDITKISPLEVSKKIGKKRIDVIVAGTPCQGFSTSGRRNPNDPRNKLFKQLLKFIRVFKPKIFVMENVSGLLSMENGNTFENIKKEFTMAGYHVEHDILSAADFGVPQSRNRVFIIGSRKPIPKKKLYPKATVKEHVKVKDALSDLCFLGINEESDTYKKPAKTKYQKLMRKNCDVLYNHKSSNHAKKIQQRFAKIPQGMDGRKVLKISDTNKRDYYRLHPNKISRAIITLPDDYIHYEKNRIPTVRELARLQSFPDSFVFLGPRTTGGSQRIHTCPQYTQVGNAVPPLLSASLFKQLANVLNEYWVMI